MRKFNILTTSSLYMYLGNPGLLLPSIDNCYPEFSFKNPLPGYSPFLNNLRNF